MAGNVAARKSGSLIKITKDWKVNMTTNRYEIYYEMYSPVCDILQIIDA